MLRYGLDLDFESLRFASRFLRRNRNNRLTLTCLLLLPKALRYFYLMSLLLLKMISILLLALLIPSIFVAADATDERLFRELLPITGYERGIEKANANDDAEQLYFVQSQESPNAYYLLGLFHLYGLHSLEPDEEAAMIWLQQAAAEGGHANAHIVAGLLLYHGIEVDRKKAKTLFQKASTQGHSYGHWYYGRSLFEEASASSEDTRNGMFKEAASLFSLVSDKIPEAVHSLAVMYEYELIHQDSSSTKDSQLQSNLLKAAELYREASQMGFVESYYHLALMYSYGRGIRQDYSMAIELFQEAATLRHAPSMRYLAVVFANGYSRQGRDYDAALRWYQACLAEDDFPDVKEICIAERDVLMSAINRARTNARE